MNSPWTVTPCRLPVRGQACVTCGPRHQPHGPRQPCSNGAAVNPLTPQAAPYNNEPVTAGGLCPGTVTQLNLRQCEGNDLDITEVIHLVIAQLEISQMLHPQRRVLWGELRRIQADAGELRLSADDQVRAVRGRPALRHRVGDKRMLTHRI